MGARVFRAEYSGLSRVDDVRSALWGRNFVVSEIPRRLDFAWTLAICEWFTPRGDSVLQCVCSRGNRR